MHTRTAIRAIGCLSKVQLGGAYLCMPRTAVLEELSPLGHPGQFAEVVRSFTARFSVQGTDPRLLPDLSAALDLDLGTQNKVLVVPWQRIGIEGGHSFVWRKSAVGFEKQSVATGSRNEL